MTEDEAKSKWCPYTRVGDKAVNRYFDDFPSHSYCIGSACMAWRWDCAGTVITLDGMITVAQLDRMKRQATPQHGFCGLAGKP